ncbi:MAG: cytochrome d ubiquinol oxidase subunit II [Actinomycetota bacterium]
MSDTALQVAALLAIGVGLTLYVLLGGADFGGGVWDLLAHGPARDRERSLIAAAIGPVWEANHVWLIFVVTALFSAFPPAFAALGVALYLPFGIALAGIVMRGASFAFRSYGDPGTGLRRAWTRMFGIASLVTPMVLGMCAAAVAAGRVRVGGDRAKESLLGSWTGPLSWVAGLLALAMCAYLAASYLTVEAAQRGDAELEERFRRRALASGAVAGVLAVAGLGAMRADAPTLWTGMTRHGWPFVVLSGLGGIAAIGATIRGRERLARAGAALAVAGVIAGWGVAQWPYVIVPDLRASDAAAPASALRPILIGYAVGAALLAPSLLLLFRVFKASRADSTDRLSGSSPPAGS